MGRRRENGASVAMIRLRATDAPLTSRLLTLLCFGCGSSSSVQRSLCIDGWFVGHWRRRLGPDGGGRRLWRRRWRRRCLPQSIRPGRRRGAPPHCTVAAPLHPLHPLLLRLRSAALHNDPPSYPRTTAIFSTHLSTCPITFNSTKLLSLFFFSIFILRSFGLF